MSAATQGSFFWKHTGLNVFVNVHSSFGESVDLRVYCPVGFKFAVPPGLTYRRIRDNGYFKPIDTGPVIPPSSEESAVRHKPEVIGAYASIYERGSDERSPFKYSSVLSVTVQRLNSIEYTAIIEPIGKDLGVFLGAFGDWGLIVPVVCWRMRWGNVV